MTIPELVRGGRPATGLRRAGHALRDRVRHATRTARLLPAFLVAGTQKGGSTSLHKALAQHPEVLAPLVKEVHYFDRHWANGLDWYRAHFPLARGGTARTFESSPSYMFHPRAPERMVRTLPDVRVVLVLRDPVDRAFSHYHMKRRAGLEPLAFRAALEAEGERLAGERERLARDDDHVSDAHRHHSYLARGRYLEQLVEIERHVPRQRLLVLRSEDLFARPDETLGQVEEFLDLGRGPRSLRRSNRGAYDPVDAADRAWLEAYFAPHNAALSAHLGRDMAWSS